MGDIQCRLCGFTPADMLPIQRTLNGSLWTTSVAICDQCIAEIKGWRSDVHSEKIKRGMEAARQDGKQVGRPSVFNRPGFAAAYIDIRIKLDRGIVSRRKAAQELGIGYATLKRLLVKEGR